MVRDSGLRHSRSSSFSVSRVPDSLAQPLSGVGDRTDHGTNSTDAIWGRARGAGNSPPRNPAGRAHDDPTLAPPTKRGLFREPRNLWVLESENGQTAIRSDGKLMCCSWLG